ncbi:hypothetical protein SDC9_157368 [bioreactor metagenome]|uniref:Uncharacterized protein n=1 Tax=bioreactor metagenome TaxID=1076179 RepID=A0A645F6S8_9ZZZZ
MGGHDHALATFDGRRQGLVPERDDPGHGVLEAFGQGHVGRRELFVAAVVALATRIGRFQRRRRGVVAAAPDQHLRFTILLGHVGLVQSLQRTVMALVESPALDHGQPGAVHGVQHMPERVGGALEHGGEGDVEGEAGFLHQAAGVLGFLDAFLGEVHVGPAGEAVFLVPGGFAVAQQHDFFHGSPKSGRR